MIIFQALKCVEKYQYYAATWILDQSHVLSIFLKFGRDLTEEEEEYGQFEVDADGEPILPRIPPKLIDFQTKVRALIEYIFE